MVYGDSLSAAYGIARARGWVALLEERLKREQIQIQIHYSVVNAQGASWQRRLSRVSD